MVWLAPFTFLRAKLCILFVLTGALTASAAVLDVSRKNAAFAPDAQNAPAIIKPADSKTKFGTSSHWRGAKVKKITPKVKAPIRIELKDVKVSKPAETAHAPAPKESRELQKQ